MNTVTPLIKDFFDRYARSRSVQDIDLIASQYPDSFMVAGPHGAKVAQKSLEGDQRDSPAMTTG